MIYCPNINSKEFQDLVSSVGEDRAYFLWNKYEGNVPNSYIKQREETTEDNYPNIVLHSKSLEKPTSNTRFLSGIGNNFYGRNKTLDENGLPTDELQNFKILTDRFLKDFNHFSERGIRIGNNSYIITGHNEIKELIKSRLTLESKDLSIKLNDIEEALKSDPENEKLLIEQKKLESDLQFNRLYERGYSFIYQQMFPNTLNKSKKVENIENLRYLFSDDTDEEDATIEEGKNNAFFFQEEIYDSFSKTSTKVKSILSNVYDYQRGKYLSWAEAYKISLEVLNDLPAQDLERWIKLVEDRVRLHNKSSYKAFFSKVKFMKDKATLDSYIDNSGKGFKKISFENSEDPNSSFTKINGLEKTDNILYYNKDFNEYWQWNGKQYIKFHGIQKVIPKNAKFINLDNSVGTETFIVAYDPSFDMSVIERKSDIDVYLKPGEYEIIEKDQNRTTRDFIQNILFRFEELDNPVFKEFENNVILLNNLRVKQYYNQALTELLQNMISQKENNRYIGSKETNEKGTDYKYYDAVRESIERSVRTDIDDKISSKLYTSKLVEDFVKETKNFYFNNNKPLVKREDQLQAVKKLLDKLGFSSYNYENISDYPISKLYKALQHFIYGNPTYSGKGSESKISSVGKDKFENGYLYQDTIGSILENEGSLKDELGKFLRFNLEADRPGMSKKANGKMVYNYTPSSNGMDILRRLAKKNYLTDKNELPYENGFEFLQTDYFKYNPFNPFAEIKKPIYQVGIHDGVVATSSFGKSGKTVVEYTKEDLNAFIDRTFNFGFLTSLNKDANLRYIQFSSPVSNRPNIPGVQVDLLSNVEFDMLTEQLLKQIVARPDHKNVQNYDRHKLVNLDKLATALSKVAPDTIKDGKVYLTESHLKNPGFIRHIAQELKQEIKKDAEILFKQVVENQITFSSSFDENGLVKLYENLKNSNKDFLDSDIDVNKITKQIKEQLSNSKYFETWIEVKKRFAEINQIQYTPDKKNSDLNNKVTNDMLKQYGYQREYKVNDKLKSAILPLFELYLRNDYLNSYFLDQMNMGGTEFFKGSVDRVKRRQGAYSPGLKGLVNSQVGMAKTFRTAVIEDPERSLKGDNNYLFNLLISTGIISEESMTPEEQNRIYKNFVNKFGDFNPADAQGYMLPERASELQKGFGESYQVGNVLKPAHYEIDKNGIPRMVKYSAVVLTDELVKDFPQLGHLRNKMRKANTGEIVYYTAFKVGAPEARLGMTKNEKGKYNFSDEEFNKLFEDNDYSFPEESIVELSNERYKLQLNPEHDLNSTVAKPTQLFYFLKILNTNLEAASRVYDSLAKIMDMELNEFKDNYINPDNTFKTEAFISYLIKKGANSATEVYHEILAELYNPVQLKNKGKDLKPWNFPGIEDKIVTQFSSTLQNDVVQTKFKGTKLVLMSQVGANMEGLDRLKYKTDENGNLYAEIYLPKKFLKPEIEEKMKQSESHIFFDPELLGFRIPSSELHSGIPIRVAGFHNLGSNVIIAPEELVPLHGSDFDVDALYVITQETKGAQPIGYKDVNGQYVFMEESEFLQSISDVPENEKKTLLKSYYKNRVSNTLIKTISSKDNRERMISPISMTKVKEIIKNLFDKEKGNPNLDPSGKIDESSAIDKQKVHSSSMNGRDGTGIFANFAKGLAYILHTSSDTENSLILKQTDKLPYFTNDLPLNKLEDVIHLWEDLDSLLNAAIDNVKEQVLPKLNLNGTTIPTFAMMLGLGIPLEEASNIMVQPIIKHLSGISGKDKNTSKGVISATNLIKGKLRQFVGNQNMSKSQAQFIINFLEDTIEDDQIILSNKEIEKAISKEIVSNSNISVNDINDLSVLITQAKVLENYKRTEAIVNEFNKIVRYLSIIRDLPVFSNKINELIDLKSQIWDENNKTLGSFPFNVDNFFESNPHIAKSDEVLQLQRELLNKNFFKHSDKIQDFFSTLNHLTFDVNKFNDIKYKQDEFIKFIYSSLYFTGSNINITPFNYKIRNFKSNKQLLGQEAFVQHFVNKIRVLKDIMPDNYFIKRFSSLDSGYSSDLKRLAFYLDNKITPLDKAEFEAAFKELAKYDIRDISKDEYNGLKNENLKYKFGDNFYRVVHRDPTAEGQSRTSDLQREFVQYNILTEGMRNSSSSYSQLLPGFIYRDQYYNYENLMKNILNNFSLKELSNIYHVYNSNITTTNADKMLDFNDPYEFKNESNYFYDSGNQRIYYDITTAFNNNSAEFIKIKHPVYKSNFKSQEDFEDNFDSLESNPEDGDERSERKPDYYQTKVYKLVYSNSEKAFYQLVSLIKNNKVYKSNSQIFSNSNEGLYNRFAPDYFHIKYSTLENGKITLANETNSNFLLNKIGSSNIPVKISISDINDPLRLDTKFIQIDKINTETRLVTFTEIPESERPMVPLVNEIVKLEPSKETIKVDKTNTEKASFTTGTQSLADVINQANKFLDPIHYELVKVLKPFITFNNTTVEFGFDFPKKKKTEKTLGMWTKVGNGKSYIIQMSSDLKTNGELSKTFTHELLHHAAYNVLNKEENLLTTQQKEAKKRLESLYRAAVLEGKKDNKNKINTYALTNLDEFVSEAFSNKEFQQWLASKKVNKKSLWTRFKNAIANIFGVSEGNMLYEVINSTLELVSNDSNTSIEEDSDISISMSNVAPLRVPNYQENFIEVRKASDDIGLKLGKDQNGEELDYYESDKQKFDRSTNELKGFQTYFIKGYNYERYKQGPIIYRAKELFKNVPEGETLYIPKFSKNVTEEEYIKEDTILRDQALLRGKMTESLFKYMITRDDTARQEVLSYMDKLPSEIYDKILLLQDNDIIRKIVFNKMKSNLLNNDGSKIDFSIPTFSKSLSKAGTIDMMIRHTDGEYSLFDMKTSQFFSEGDFTNMFAYGLTNEFNITYTERNKAKLQIMFYALMVRLNNPNIKFKKLSILHLPITNSKENFMKLLDRNTLSDDIVEVNSFLPMIKSFLENKKHQLHLGLIKEGDKSLYEQLEEEYKVNGGTSIDDLFNSKNYINSYDPNFGSNLSTVTYGKELLTKKSEEEKILQEILLLDSTERDDLKIMNPTKDEVEIKRFGENVKIKSLEKYRKERLLELIQQWINLTGDKGLVYLSTKDIDFLHLNIGSNKDIDNNPIFATWNKFKFARQNKARFATEEKVLELRSLVDKVLPKSSPINMNSQRKLFGKFIKKEYNQKLGKTIERLVHKDLNDAEYISLSNDEKAFVDYINNTFASYFSKDAYLNTVGSFYINDRGQTEGITHLEAYNKGKDPFEYYPGWFPKTPILPEEYQERIMQEKGTIEGGKKLISNWANRQLTKYFENLFNINEDTAAIPIKYLGNSEIEDKQLYSVKLDKVFEMFIDAIERKIHLDEVYHTGRAITMLLQEDNDTTGPTSYFDPESKQWKQKYENLTKFIKDRIEYEIKDIPITKVNYLNKELIVGDKKIDIDKSMLLLSQGATASVMWLKPISGLGNMLMGNMVKYKEALKYSVGKRLIGELDSKQIDYTYSDALWAEKEYMKLSADSMMGESKLYSNKLFLIAEKFGYLADNYRFGSNSRKFKSDRNPLFSSDNMYIFHTIGEKYLSYTTLAAQLKHYTIKVDGKDVPIYDLYKAVPIEGSKYSKLEWIGPERTIQDGNVTRKVNGISDDEMYRFKAVSARMQGDYRREESIRLEHYALGKITVVLKKFFPRLILNGLQGKQPSRALGWYNEVSKKDENGNDITVLEWNAREIEGKWRTLANAFAAIIRINPHISAAGGFMEYWSRASNEQKLNLIDALVTASFVILAYGGYILLFGDADDDDTWKKAWKTYLIDNASQQYNFIDLLRTGTTVATPVVVKKAYDFATAGTQLILFNGLDEIFNDGENVRTEKGDIRGLNTFLKSVPYTAFGQDFYNKVNNINVDQYGFFDFKDNKLR